jgi:hypothetical protein
MELEIKRWCSLSKNPYGVGVFDIQANSERDHSAESYFSGYRPSISKAEVFTKIHIQFVSKDYKLV